jgi:hypothetical protein
MSSRTIHQINSECEVLVERINRNRVLVRIVEKDPELPNPTDLAVEGDLAHILNAFSSCALVLSNINEFLEESN